MSRVIIWKDANGNERILAEPGARVFYVDERTPHDRVFQVTANATEQEIADALADDLVGHGQDDRQKRLEVQVHYMEGGLTLVKNDEA